MIQTEQVGKTYNNGFQAVRNLTMKVDKGDIFGFLGPNGAGKTTTIRMLDGLLEPTTGKVVVGGYNIIDHPMEIKKLVGVVPESHGYYYWMTAQQYLEYFNSLFNGKEANAAYISHLLDKVGLSEKKNVAVGQFSRGMKQRLGIAKALVNKPKIIFLDEPTLGLDPRGQKEVQQLILDINRNDNITVFITSHLLKDIEVLCNKVSIIKDGVLIEQGSIKQLQDKYMSQISLELITSDNEKVKKLLADVKDIESIENEGEYLITNFKNSLSDKELEDTKYNIISAILGARVDIKEMSKKTLTMEDIFFKVTERSVV